MIHICLPSCSAFGGKCDKGCGQAECGKARQVRRLIKRFVPEETCEVKCVHHEVVDEQPCPKAKSCAPAACAPAPCATPCPPAPCASPCGTVAPRK